MKKILFLLVWIFPLISFSQTFEDAVDHAISEDGDYHCNTIAVSGVGMISDKHGLEKVCVIIDDDNDGDLSIYLVSPDGTAIELSSNNGGSGADYGSSTDGDFTCFTMSASTDITAGTAPFVGDFKPEGDMGLVNNFQDANGDWKICLKDDNSNGTSITLKDWKLIFSDDVASPITRIQHDCDDTNAYFFDLGGDASNYSSGEYHIWVICSDEVNKDIVLKFEEWGVEDSVNDDQLSFWNDTAITGSVYAIGDGLNSLHNVSIRSNNPYGCLTIRWMSDADTLVGLGWKAKIGCRANCQTVNFAWDGTDGNEDTNYIAVCPGQEVSFSAHGIYPENDDMYHQEDATSTFLWNFGDGSSLTGATVTHAYDKAQGYDVNLTVIDVNGCRSKLYLGKRVKVSIPPTFTNTASSKDTTFIGDNVDLLANTQMYGWSSPEPDSVNWHDTIPLPDGSGVYYYAKMRVENMVLGETLSDVSQIDSILTSFEHSYVGDLTVWLICPTGESIVLFDGNDADDDLDGDGHKNSLGDFLGIPFSDDDNVEGPGEGWTYCFKDGPSQLLTDGPTQNVTTQDGQNDGASILGGTFKPRESFDNLIGCPLNGTWTLKVLDDQMSDDGYLFGWYIQFVDSLYRNTWGYQMVAVDSSWEGVDGTTVDTTTNPPQGNISKEGENKFRYSITDQFGCSYDTIITVIGTDFNLQKQDIQCHGDSNGIVQLVIVNEEKYSHYYWQLPDGTTGDDSVATMEWDSLSAGTFYITIEDTAGSQKTDSIEFIDPAPMSVSVMAHDNTCEGNTDGYIEVMVSGGTLPYNYAWNTGDSIQNLMDLSAGNYVVTVTDNHGCFDSVSTTLTEAPTPIVTVGSKPTTCGRDNGQVFITSMSGGTPPYRWTWSPCSSDCDADTLSNIATGVYQLQVYDSNNCTVTVQDTVGYTDAVRIDFIAITDVKCNGSSDGTATIFTNGVAKPYTYTWSPSVSTDSTDTNLIAGTYMVTVEDTNHCTDSKVFSIDEPDALHIQLDGPATPICIGQYASLSAAGSGGTPPYTYIWDHDTSLHAQNISVNPTVTTTYRVQAKDANGCLSPYATVTVTVPPALTMTVVSINNVSCPNKNDGSITISAGGGSGAYNCSWSSGSTSFMASSLRAGTYTVTISDQNCPASFIDSSFTITEPDPIEVNISTESTACGENNGTVQVTVTEGSGDYSYEWSNGDNTDHADSLSAGTGSVRVIDNETGCSVTRYFTIENSDAPSLTLTGKNIACNGDATGEIDLTITGTTYPYEVMWSNGISTTISGTTATHIISNLEAGSYEVDVIDTNGCLAHGEIVLTENDPITLAFNAENASCGNNDGAISLTITGGTAPYSVTWNTGDTTTHPTNLLAGSFGVTVSDSNGCSTTGTTAVVDSGAPVITVDSIISARCDQKGAIYVTVTNIDTLATYLWDLTVSSEDLIDANPGNHTLVVDDNGCKAVLNATIPYLAPQVQTMGIVTVDSSTAANLVVWRKQDTTAVDHYNIYREGSKPGEYFLLKSVSVDSVSYFVDSSAYSWIRSYRYKISTVDKCGNESELSPAHKTIHLTVNMAYTTTAETKVNLIWDDYEGFDYSSFYINRYTLHDGWVVLDSLPIDLHSYTTVVPEGGAIYVVTVRRSDVYWANRDYSGPYSQSYSNVDDLRANGSGQNINHLKTIGNIALYPNPNDGSFTVTGNHIVAVDIYNANGQLIEQHRTATVNYLFLKPRTKLTEGIYFVKIMTQNAIVVKKIVVK